MRANRAGRRCRRRARLPDRLVLLGYNAGAAGARTARRADPVAAHGRARSLRRTRTSRSDETARTSRSTTRCAWMTDFERAVEVGMASAIPLSATAFRRGFDKLMVLGVRMRSTPSRRQGGARGAYSAPPRARRAGFSILPQGRPTNNVEGESAAYSWHEDPDVSFDHYFGAPAADPAMAGSRRRDGRWLAEMLGLDPADACARIPFYRPHRRRRRARDEHARSGRRRSAISWRACSIRSSTTTRCERRASSSRRHVLGARAAAGDPRRQAALRHPAGDARARRMEWLSDGRGDLADHAPRSSSGEVRSAGSLRAAAHGRGRSRPAAREGFVRRQAGRRPAPGAARRARPACRLGRVPAALRRELRAALQPAPDAGRGRARFSRS